jgi:hypothetical protein
MEISSITTAKMPNLKFSYCFMKKAGNASKAKSQWPHICEHRFASWNLELLCS